MSMNRFYILVSVFVLFCSTVGEANQQLLDQLYGSWVVDIDATIERTKSNTATADDVQISRTLMQESLAGWILKFTDNEMISIYGENKAITRYSYESSDGNSVNLLRHGSTDLGHQMTVAFKDGNKMSLKTYVVNDRVNALDNFVWKKIGFILGNFYI